MGIDIDMKNAYTRGEEISISSDKSKVKILVVPTDEELMIANDTYDLVF